MYLLRDNPVKAPTRAIRRRATSATSAALLGAMVWAAVLMSGVDARAQCPPLATAAKSIPPLLCRYDAALTALFTPRTAPDGTYRVYVTSSPLDDVAEQLRHMADDKTTPGWLVQGMDPLDAFGSAGAYDQTMLARLYVGRRARVARGPVVENGRVTASVWLISPYPNPSLSRLERGTLIIEFRVDKVKSGG